MLHSPITYYMTPLSSYSVTIRSSGTPNRLDDCKCSIVLSVLCKGLIVIYYVIFFNFHMERDRFRLRGASTQQSHVPQTFSGEHEIGYQI